MERGAHCGAWKGHKQGVCLPVNDTRISCRGAKLAFRKCRVQHFNCSPAGLHEKCDISVKVHNMEQHGMLM